MVSLQRAQTPVCTRGLDEKTRARLPQETNSIANKQDRPAPRTSAATRPTPRDAHRNKS